MLFLLRNARYVKVVRQVFAFFRVSEQELTEMVIRKMSQHEEFAFDHNTFFLFSALCLVEARKVSFVSLPRYSFLPETFFKLDFYSLSGSYSSFVGTRPA